MATSRPCRGSSRAQRKRRSRRGRRPSAAGARAARGEAVARPLRSGQRRARPAARRARRSAEPCGSTSGSRTGLHETRADQGAGPVALRPVQLNASNSPTRLGDSGESRRAAISAAAERGGTSKLPREARLLWSRARRFQPRGRFFVFIGVILAMAPDGQTASTQGKRSISASSRKLGRELSQRDLDLIAAGFKRRIHTPPIAWRPLLESYAERNPVIHVHIETDAPRPGRDDLSEARNFCATFEWPSGRSLTNSKRGRSVHPEQDHPG